MRGTVVLLGTAFSFAIFLLQIAVVAQRVQKIPGGVIVVSNFTVFRCEFVLTRRALGRILILFYFDLSQRHHRCILPQNTRNFATFFHQIFKKLLHDVISRICKCFFVEFLVTRNSSNGIAAKSTGFVRVTHPRVLANFTVRRL